MKSKINKILFLITIIFTFSFIQNTFGYTCGGGGVCSEYSCTVNGEYKGFSCGGHNGCSSTWVFSGDGQDGGCKPGCTMTETSKGVSGMTSFSCTGNIPTQTTGGGTSGGGTSGGSYSGPPSGVSVIPGTIQKGTANTTFQCGVSSHSYVTSNGCTTAGNCNWSCDGYDIYGRCTGGSYKSSGGETYWSSSTSYNDYTSNSQVIPYNGSVKITSDTQTCNPRTTGVASSASMGGSTSCSGSPCGGGGAGSWYVPVHGYCSSSTSVKTIISSFDQLGNRVYSFNNFETTVSNSAKDVNLTATCQIEGRYATGDNTPPSVSVNNISQVFSSDLDKWCNIKKYTQQGYTYKKEENAGCEFYKAKNAGVASSLNDDLLKGLEITIGNDDSGINSVEIQLGKCNAIFTPDDSSLANIIVSSSSPSGVKSVYKNGFTLKYDQSINALNKTQPSLLQAFGVDRLDKCLEEGKNKLTILAKDMARSESDGTTLAANYTKQTISSINIDNSTPKIQLLGDMSETTMKSGTNQNSFLNLDKNDPNYWRNYTLNGNIKSAEKYMGGADNECKTFSGSELKCSGNLSGGQIWIAPSGVNPTTGKFMAYTCDGLGPFPPASECRMGCPIGEVLKNGNCVKNTCSNGEVINGVCINYCIPDHSVDCIVKEGEKAILPPISTTIPGPASNGSISTGNNIDLITRDNLGIFGIAITAYCKKANGQYIQNSGNKISGKIINNEFIPNITEYNITMCRQGGNGCKITSSYLPIYSNLPIYGDIVEYVVKLDKCVSGPDNNGFITYSCRYKVTHTDGTIVTEFYDTPIEPIFQSGRNIPYGYHDNGYICE